MGRCSHRRKCGAAGRSKEGRPINTKYHCICKKRERIVPHAVKNDRKEKTKGRGKTGTDRDCCRKSSVRSACAGGEIQSKAKVKLHHHKKTAGGITRLALFPFFSFRSGSLQHNRLRATITLVHNSWGRTSDEGPPPAFPPPSLLPSKSRLSLLWLVVYKLVCVVIINVRGVLPESHE